MTPGSLWLMLIAFLGLPATAMVAAFLGWWAFQSATPNRTLFGLAWAVLVSPLVLLGVVIGGEGVTFGMANLYAIPSYIVALELGTKSYRRRRSARKVG